MTARTIPINWSSERLGKIFLGGEQHYIGTVLLAKLKFSHLEEIVPTFIVADTSLVSVPAKRLFQY